VEKEGKALDLPSLCASLQKAVSDTFTGKVNKALKETKARRLVLAGGVAANLPLREAMNKLANRHNAEFLVPGLHLCTDNAAMIAAHGFVAKKEGCNMPENPLLVNATANWEMGGEYYF
jgi:N6-L-threonylcarbamoyladenine synthase